MPNFYLTMCTARGYTSLLSVLIHISMRVYYITYLSLDKFFNILVVIHGYHNMEFLYVQISL